MGRFFINLKAAALKTMPSIHYSADTTSSLQSITFPAPRERISVFTHHALKAGKTEIMPKPHNADWITILLLAGFIILAWNHVFNPNRLVQVFKAPFSRRFLNQLVRDGNLFRERIAFTLMILYLFLGSLFVYLLNDRFIGIRLPETGGILQFLLIVIVLSGYLFVKSMLISILGNIFKTRETTYHYLLNQLIFAMISAPFLLILIALIVFVKLPILYYITGIVFILFLLVRFIRGFFIGMTLTKFSYLLLFVYLCTLEILPLLVVYKLIVDIAKYAVV